MNMIAINTEILEAKGFEYDAYWEGYVYSMGAAGIMLVKVEDDNKLDVYEAPDVMSEFEFIDSVSDVETVLEMI